MPATAMALTTSPAITIDTASDSGTQCTVISASSSWLSPRPGCDSPVARNTRTTSSVNPGEAAASTSTRQVPASIPASSSSSRAAARWVSSPGISSSPAGSSHRRCPSGCRYWYTSASRPVSSTAATATAP
ncbi:Uncharacterised protein [Mycobacteroides abscessus subsp. abscessus]|nr:Uncharacterised protein [Mycobacteroides abscessus subsp. abscessus]